MRNDLEYFTRFPNKYIRCDVKTQYGVSRKFYITYILIDRYRSVENFSWITVAKVLEFYGYKNARRKPKAFGEILDVLEFMINNRMITVVQDLNTLNYDTGIEIKVIPENFDSPKEFAKLTTSQLEAIMLAESTINKENLLIAFLYINSYIGCRKRSEDGLELQWNPQNYPEAFFGSIQKMATTLSMSKDTIYQCLNFLASDKPNGTSLLLKRELSDEDAKNFNAHINATNIYVLNNERCEQEIEWALKKMSELYRKPIDEISV